MSYLVLARKLRPARFQDLIGQEPIWQTLINSIAQNRVAHAFLFTGPRGTGKTSCARILTKALNCKNPQNFEPCNECENCVEINQGIAQDVMEIDAASNRGIEHIRELRESVKFSPAKFPYKTYIIDEVHMLTTESFNALLKTLEEPPEHVKFILATTDFHKIPTTVISRCQRYDFHHIAVDVMTKHLQNVAEAEGIQISEVALSLISRSSTGGMRDALTTLDMLISFGSGTIEDQQVIEVLGLNNQQEVDAILKAIVHRDLETALHHYHTLLKRGLSFGQLIHDLSTAIKELALLQRLRLDQLTWKEFLPDQLDLYQELAKEASQSDLQLCFQTLLELEQQIKRSSQAELCVEMGLIRLCSMDKMQGVSEVLSLLRSAKEGKKKTLLN